MFRRLCIRLVCLTAVRLLSVPCAVWFGSRVLMIVPGNGFFLLTPEQARDLAAALHAATRVPTPPQR